MLRFAARGSDRIVRWAAALLVIMTGSSCSPGQVESPEENATAADTATEKHSDDNAAAAVEPERYNVIWILLDAARASNFSCYGYERPTSPNIDGLAESGAVFLNHFTQAHATVPSVPSYMTGRYFPTSCVASRGWESMFVTSPDGERLLPEVMAENGYHTKLVSATHWVVPNSRLFEAFEERAYYPAEEGQYPYTRFEHLNEEVIPWLENQGDEPFFLYLHTLDTHHPHFPNTAFNPWVDAEYTSPQINKEKGQPAFPSGKAKFSDQDIQYLEDIYDGSIAYADHHVGRIVQALEEHGLRENTILIISSDHGDTWGEDGTTWGHPPTSADEIMRTPLIISGPPVQPSRVETITENVDIVATLVDVLGLESDAAPDGLSLAPLWHGDAGSPDREYAFFSLNGLKREGPAHVVLSDGEFKYERDFKTEKGILWQVPDSLQNRNDVASMHPEVVERMESVLVDQYMPFYERLARQSTYPPDRPFVELLPESAEPASAYVGKHVVEDGKWFLELGGLKATWKEDPEPITTQLRVPPGRFLVELNLFAQSAVHYKAQLDEAFSLAENLDENNLYRYIPLGEYVIEDGIFTITFDNVVDRRAFMLNLRFIPSAVADSYTPSQEESERDEALRAVGYL